MNDSERFVARASPWRTALLTLASAGFVALCFFLLSIHGTDRIIVLIVAIFGIAFFGLCTILWGRKLVSRAPVVAVSADGILSHQWSDEIIPWKAVKNMWIWQFGNERMACLKLKEPDLYPGRGIFEKLGRSSKKLTGADIHVSATGTDRTASELFGAMEHFSGMRMRK